MVPTTAWAQPPSQRTAPSTNKPNRATQGQPAGQPCITQPITEPVVSSQGSITPTSRQNGQAPDQSSNCNGTKADWWIIALTLAFAIVSFVLALIAGQQVSAQTRDTEDALPLIREANRAATTDRKKRMWLTLPW